MSKAEKAEYRALETYHVLMCYNDFQMVEEDINKPLREIYKEGYHQAEKDIKEELSNLFQEFMLDCINDDTETHILHFIDVFNNKIKTIGNE